VVAYQQDMEGLVGMVVAVGPGSSEIRPLYDPQCMVSARLYRTRDEGLVNGEGKDSSTVLMRYVKKIAKDSIDYGDLVVTSGLGGLYPKGINIGRIRDIRAQAYETSLELEVQPIIDFDRLEYVFLFVGEAVTSSDQTSSLGASGASGASSASKATKPGSALP
jgi:rod shape-determining protein MreC